MIDKNQINQLNEKKNEDEMEELNVIRSPNQGFEVGDRPMGVERTSLVLDTYNLDLLDENTYAIKKALKKRSINRSVLVRVAIHHFNQLSEKKKLALVQKVL